MKIYNNPPESAWKSICKRPLFTTEDLEKKVKNIMNAVKDKGDEALLEFTQQYEGIQLNHLKVKKVEFDLAQNQIPKELKEAIQFAATNIGKFHEAQNLNIESIETSTGVECWRKNVAIENVGLYIPGGTAPLFSTILMLAIPAKIAGCKRIVLCTPPRKDGSIHPAILYTASFLGIDEVYKIGGAQAVAAMAYGTESIELVNKIFGPGNQYVTKAKELVQSQGIAIDMPAGPSELLVIADQYADPDFVAADLLSQAEHGVDSQVVLLTDDKSLVQKVEGSLQEQIKQLPRKAIAQKSLKNSFSIFFANSESLMKFSNYYAPEHLIINTKNPEDLVDDIVNAGSVFLGAYSCESAGDYASGTNHTLPTNGHAKSYSGVSLDSFVKKITFQKLSKQGIQALGKCVEMMAEAEGLDAHKNAVSIRLKKLQS